MTLAVKVALSPNTTNQPTLSQDKILVLSKFKPHSLVSNITDLRAGGRWFDPRLGQYSED